MMRGMLRARERTTVSPYFPVGGPVPAADLVGRESYLRRLVDRLEDGNHVLVAGPRRLGKTALILEGPRRPKRHGGPTRHGGRPRATHHPGLGERPARALLMHPSGGGRSLEQGKDA